MNGDDLDKAQTQKTADALFPSIYYLVRLKQRMHAKGFEPGDPLLALTEKAYDAVQNLYLDLLSRSATGNMRPVVKPSGGAAATADKVNEMAKPHYDPLHPQNLAVQRYLALGKTYTLHPDILDRMIELAAALKECERRTFHGARLLFHKKTGVILSFAIGTEYCLRVDKAFKEAKEAALTWSLRPRC